jgi:hypothetical protein
MAQLNVQLKTESMRVTKTEEEGFRHEMRVDDPQISGPVTSKVVYFPVAPGVLVRAWSQIVFGLKEDWYVLVDARRRDALAQTDPQRRFDEAKGYSFVPQIVQVTDEIAGMTLTAQQ